MRVLLRIEFCIHRCVLRSFSRSGTRILYFFLGPNDLSHERDVLRGVEHTGDTADTSIRGVEAVP